MKWTATILILLFALPLAGQTSFWFKGSAPASDSLDFGSGIGSATLYWHVRARNSARIGAGTDVDSIIDLARGRFTVPVSTKAQYNATGFNSQPSIVFTNDPYVDNAADTRSAYQSLHNGSNWMLIAVIKWEDAPNENSALFGNYDADDQGGRGATVYFVDATTNDSILACAIGNTGTNFNAMRQFTNAGQFPADPASFTYLKIKHFGTGTANAVFQVNGTTLTDAPSDQDGVYNTGTATMDMHLARRGTTSVFMDGGEICDFAIWIGIPSAGDELLIDQEINRLYGL